MENKLEMLVVEVSEMGEDDGKWTPRMREDLPEWVLDPAAMGELRDGTKLCADPERHTLWYRGLRVKK